MKVGAMSGGIYLRVMEVDDGFMIKVVVSVCDEELLGKVFREGDRVLAINKEFFGGQLLSTDYEDEIIDYLRRAYTAMIVGERSVSLALKNRVIHPEAVMRIAGVPYAQIVRY